MCVKITDTNVFPVLILANKKYNNMLKNCYIKFIDRLTKYLIRYE